jgi:hypothetical protein
METLETSTQKQTREFSGVWICVHLSCILYVCSTLCSQCSSYADVSHPDKLVRKGMPLCKIGTSSVLSSSCNNQTNSQYVKVRLYLNLKKINISNILRLIMSHHHAICEIINRVFHLPTDKQESCRKNIKIYIKTAPTFFGLITIIR